MKIKEVLLFFTALSLLTIVLTGCPENSADSNPPGLENNPPAGSAGIVKAVLIGETVSLEASASDADTEDTLSYQWSISTVPSGSSITTASITAATTLNPSFTPDIPGDYTVQLTISDSTASITAEAAVHVVSYAFGLNFDDNEHSGYIHDGELYQVTNPYPINDECDQESVIIYEGTVYTTGMFLNADGDEQAVYWSGITPTEIDDPSFGMGNYTASKIVFDSNDAPELIVTNGTDPYYWKNSSGYLYDDDAITGEGTGMDYYRVSNIFREGNDVFQIGAAMKTGAADHYFMARNNVVIVDDAEYNPDPLSDSEFMQMGILFVRGASDEQSKVYLYGMYNTSSFVPEYRAGYFVNDVSGWQELYYDDTHSTDPQFVIHMISPDDYILRVPDEESNHGEVWLNSIEASMEVPHTGETGVMVENINYIYMEEIGGSMFVAGGYSCTIGADPCFKVGAVWRDGAIVAEVWDDNPSDGMDCENAYMTGADFE